MVKRFMQCAILMVALLLVGSTAVLAAGGEVQDIGSWSDPTTGEIFKFVNAKSNDSLRQNQSIIYVIHTSVQKDERTGKWAPKTNMLIRDAASSDGLWNNFGKGGAAGLFQAGGMIGFGALLRPSNTSMTDNSGSNNTGSGNITATGGAATGGAGGSGGAGGGGGKGGVGNHFGWDKEKHGDNGNHFGWDKEKGKPN